MTDAPESEDVERHEDANGHENGVSAATLLLSQGLHPKVVSEMLGDRSIGITLDTYSHR